MKNGPLPPLPLPPLPLLLQPDSQDCRVYERPCCLLLVSHSHEFRLGARCQGRKKKNSSPFQRNTCDRCPTPLYPPPSFSPLLHFTPEIIKNLSRCFQSYYSGLRKSFWKRVFFPSSLSLVLTVRGRAAERQTLCSAAPGQRRPSSGWLQDGAQLDKQSMKASELQDGFRIHV